MNLTEAAREFYQWCAANADKPPPNAEAVVTERLTQLLAAAYERGIAAMRVATVEAITRLIGDLSTNGHVDKVAVLVKLREQIEVNG